MVLQSRNDILCPTFFVARFHEKFSKTRRKGTRVNWEALTINQPWMHVKELENRRGQVNVRRKNWTYSLVEEYATLLISFSPGIKTELVETKTLLQSWLFWRSCVWIFTRRMPTYYHKLCHDQFLPQPFYFIVFWQNHSTRYKLGFLRCVVIRLK
jgi:hypothetical protein